MILVDTGPLVAAANERDQLHDVCARALERAEPPLLVSGLVIAEVSYHFVRAGGPGAEAPFLRSFNEGFLTLIASPPDRGATAWCERVAARGRRGPRSA